MGINTIRQMAPAPPYHRPSGVFSVFSLAVIFYRSVELGLMAALMAAIIIGATAAGGYVPQHWRRETEMLGKVSSLVLQLLTGIAKLRVAGAEMRAFAVWSGSTRSEGQRRQGPVGRERLVVFNSASGVLTYTVIFATVAYVLGGGGARATSSFNTAFAQFLFASAGITTAFTTILQAALLREGEADPAHPARGRRARPWRA